MQPPKDFDNPDTRKEENEKFNMRYKKKYYEINMEIEDEVLDLSDEIGMLKPGQLIFNQQNNTYYYVYQTGSNTGIQSSLYPNLPSKLFEDTPRNRVKEIYGVDPYSEKL